MAKRKANQQASLPGFEGIAAPEPAKPAKPERTAYGVGRKGRRPILCFYCLTPMVATLKPFEMACPKPACGRSSQGGLLP